MNTEESSIEQQVQNGAREYYQVAYTANDEKTLKRELSSLTKVRDSYPKYLLTTDFETSNIEGIQRLNITYWLLEKNNLILQQLLLFMLSLWVLWDILFLWFST